MSMETLATFLGWCTVINFAFLFLASIMLVATRGWVSSIHGKMFALAEGDLAQIYFKYLAYYKIGIILFNLVPYVSLRIML